MDIQTQSSLLAAIVCLAIAIGIQIRGRRSRLHLYFVVLNVVYSLWSLSSFLHDIAGQRIWYRISMLAALALPWASLRFFQTFLGEVSNRVGNATAIVSLLLVPFILSPLVLNRWLGLFVLIYVFAVLYLCIYLIYRRLRMTESRLESARLWYLVIGGLVAVTFSLTDYLPKIDVFFPTLGNVFTLIFMFFLSQILVQYRLLDLSEFFGKIAVLGLLVSLLAAIYGALIWLVGDEPGILFFTSVVASFVVLILFEPLRIFVEARISRYGLRERFEFARELDALRREMANVLELGPMVQLIFERFENSRRITHAALYLLEDDAHTYKCIGHVGPQPAQSFDYLSRREFVEVLREGNWLVREQLEDDIVDLRELGVQAGERDGDEMTADEQQLERLEGLLDAMDALNAGVVFPIMSEHRLIGFLTLWDSRVREAFIHDELKAVQQVAHQIAIVVENSRLVAKLRERDRLAALGEMAAGLAHEIRNPLGAIKGAAQLLEPTSEETDPDEAEEFLEVIVEEVDRLNTVVSQFLDYARPDRADDASVELNSCVERTLPLLRQHAEEREVDLQVELSDGLPPVRGEVNRLTQVFLNLGLNAIEAMHDAEVDTRRLRIETGLATRREPALGGTLAREVVEVRFTDTGPGMGPETLRNIFIPFYTTKQSGTGLGLSICQRIVRGFGGALEVSSELGEGATFSVHLPIWGEEAITGTSLRREEGRTRPTPASTAPSDQDGTGVSATRASAS